MIQPRAVSSLSVFCRASSSGAGISVVLFSGIEVSQTPFAREALSLNKGSLLFDGASRARRAAARK